MASTQDDAPFDTLGLEDSMSERTGKAGLDHVLATLPSWTLYAILLADVVLACIILAVFT